jgi:hypothetical protein
MTLTDHPGFLRAVLLIDAASCAAMGLLMTFGATPIALMTELPAALLTAAGASLFPIAAFIAFVGTREPIPLGGVWLVIAGNVGWVLGSVLLAIGDLAAPNVLGVALTLGQGAAVMLLALLEFAGLRQHAVAA